MPRELTFTVETRQCGEPYRVTWRGHGEQIACDAARALAKEIRVLDGFDRCTIPVHPYIRVRQAKRVVLNLTPQNRR